VNSSATATSVCPGTPVTLTATGALSYLWTGGITDGVAFIPTFTDTYTRYRHDGNSCINTSTKTITVNPPPVAPAITAGGATTFCNGGSVTLSAAEVPVDDIISYL